MLFAAQGTSPGSPGSAPGERMQNSTKSTAPGASEYAAGHEMQNAKKSTAPGASEYAPGHQTTTGAAKTKKKPCEEEDRLDAGNSVGPFFRSTYRRCKQQNNQVRNSGWQAICLAESQRKQAGEEQDKTGNGHGQKTV